MLKDFENFNKQANFLVKVYMKKTNFLASETFLHEEYLCTLDWLQQANIVLVMLIPNMYDQNVDLILGSVSNLLLL